MRNKRYDEVYTGGLGGYSIVNMILSLFQEYPALVELNCYGRTVFQFFEVYGFHFQYDKAAISVHHKRYVKKPPDTTRSHSQPQLGLCILDPLNIDFNVARGSFLMFDIRETFISTYMDILVTLKRNADEEFLDKALCMDTGQIIQSISAIRSKWNKFCDKQDLPVDYFYRIMKKKSLFGNGEYLELYELKYGNPESDDTDIKGKEDRKRKHNDIS
jgi:non-canonical poly(A) RNA polymerase PAPD5/7